MKKYILFSLFLLTVFKATASDLADSDTTKVKQTLINAYEVYNIYDIDRYRELNTDDYILLENGEIWDLEKEIEYMKLQSSIKRKRKDEFDFREIKIMGDVAWLAYYLNSEVEKEGEKTFYKWLESVIMEKENGKWKISLLHSTLISKTIN